jgi:hypothetical protein
MAQEQHATRVAPSGRKNDIKRDQWHVDAPLP